MATIKVACPKCGQKVSGDESFYGTVVECPICSSDIRFPGPQRAEPKAAPDRAIMPVPPEPAGEAGSPRPDPPAERPPVPAEDITPPASAGAATGIPAAPAPDHDPEGPELPPSPLWGAISIVSAILSIVLCVLGGVLFAPLAIIFGHTALAKARHSPVQPAPGHTLGAIGLMIGYVSLVMTILVLLALVLFGENLRELVGGDRG